ncbi:MAG: hypothetical protein K2H43_04615, partial [Clostridia bacterium]|nr:hypothetical protein [Clostridia bacterium]
MEEKEWNESKKQDVQGGSDPYGEDGFWDERSSQNSGDPSAVSKARPQMPRKNRNIALALGAVVLAILFFFVGWLSHYYSLSKEERKLLWIFDRVENDYYKKLTDEERDAYYSGIFDAAMPDIFSTYFSPSDFEKLNSEREGSNADTGFSAFMDGDQMRVFLVQGNSPAELAGVKSGMTIYRFGKDQDSLQTGNLDDLRNFVRTNKGTFCLECGYSAEEKILCEGVESKKYLASYCSYADSETSFGFRTFVNENGKEYNRLTDTGVPMSGLDGKTAYIRLSEFGGNAAEEFTACLETMAERK